jgi:2-amino-4-hydroxy-6-hydroxymethyldihydropteridine diphosphokinase
MPEEEVFLALGSSLGDRLAHLVFAVSRIGALAGTRVTAASRVYETAPAGGVAKNFFLNAALKIETSLPPEELLAALKDIERAAGRLPGERWADRELDIDILYYGDLVLETEAVTIPHPHVAERPFVLLPLAEVMADSRDTARHDSVVRMLDECVHTEMTIKPVISEWAAARR